MLNPLFTQLFGREVVDRLDRAGFESNADIADAGEDAVSVRAGLDELTSQRIVALASETCEPGPAIEQFVAETLEEQADEPLPAGSESAPNQIIEPEFEPLAADSVLAQPDYDQPITAAGAREDEPVAATPKPDSGMREIAPAEAPATPEAEPFVDDSGLISWMGFAARRSPEGTLVSPLADLILEPESTSPREATEPRRRVTLEHSLWGFGSRPHSGETVSSTPKGETVRRDEGSAGGRSADTVKALPFHRRRIHDGH